MLPDQRGADRHLGTRGSTAAVPVSRGDGALRGFVGRRIAAGACDCLRGHVSCLLTYRCSAHQPWRAATDRRFRSVSTSTDQPCDGEPEILTSETGVEFVRTADSCFDGLVDWPYEPRHLAIDDLRQSYVDEGPSDGEVVLLLHGQPSWSYVNRTMIPPLVEAGHRVVAMDHLGFGRSDKPIDPRHHSFDRHVDRLVGFVHALDLTGANLFAHDWGSVFALWAVADEPALFRRLVIGNGGVPDVYKGFTMPAELDDMSAAFAQVIAMMPKQQPPFFDADGTPLLPTPAGEAGDASAFGVWAGFAMHSMDFSPSTMVQALTYRPLSDEEERGFGAPHPRREYMAAPRAFPSLLNDLVGRTDAQKVKLMRVEAPLLALFGGNDPGLVGDGDGRPFLTTKMPGAAGQPHHTYDDASHFLQNDKGPDIARRIISFISSNPL